MAQAGGLPLGAYVRGKLLSDASERRQARQRNPIRHAEPLARALALLGQSDLARSFNELAKAASVGALPVDPDIEAEIRAGCRQISEIRQLLMHSLGIVVTDQPEALPMPEFREAVDIAL